MRNVVAACCCAIVGLEVLIAVPLITCLAVLGMVGGEVVPHYARDPSVPQYAEGPPSYFPPPPLSPAGFDGQTTPPPAITQWTAPPAACQTTEAPPSLSPQVEAIAEARERVGSPLAESSLAGDPATTHADTVAVLERVAAQDTAPPLADSPSSQLPPEPMAALKPAPEAAAQCPQEWPAKCPNEHPVQASLVDSLRAAADQLYIKAHGLEIDGNFGRADQIRTLAREIRGEIDLLRRESGETPPPAAVTAASYDSSLPDEPAVLNRIDEPVAAANPISLPSPLVPVRAELVENRPEPPLIMVIRPGIIIQEEEEEKLGIETAPQNPTP